MENEARVDPPRMQLVEPHFTSRSAVSLNWIKEKTNSQSLCFHGCGCAARSQCVYAAPELKHIDVTPATMRIGNLLSTMHTRQLANVFLTSQFLVAFPMIGEA